MICGCPVCGKEFDVLWPQLWRYKEGKKFYCTWKCLREMRKGRKEADDMYTKTKKDGTPAKRPGPKPKTAAEAMQGMKDAADDFFKKCEDMGLKGLQAETPEQPTIKLDGAITIQAKDVGAVTVETPEGEYSTPPFRMAKLAKPLNYDGYEVCCIQSKALGRFYFDCDHNRLDWTTAEGEEVSFSPAGWKKFMEEMPKIAAILGVEL